MRGISGWMSRYELPRGAERASRFDEVERLAVPLALDGRDPETGAELLKAQLSKVFVVTDQGRTVLQTWMAVALAHCQSHFTSPESIVRGLYDEWPWGLETYPAIVFTGLAGSGKTELVNAFGRLLRPASSVDLPGHQGISLVPAWFMTLRDGSAVRDLLARWLDQHEPSRAAGRKAPRHADLLRTARKLSFLHSVCLQIVDEFQFISRSHNANVKATNLLLQLLGIGPRLIYCANYSLVHALKKRAHEDRQRLVTRYIHLRPEVLTSPDGIRVLTEYFKVAPDDFDLNPCEIAEQVQHDTYGIDRVIVDLLSLAWQHAKERSRKAKVTADDLKWAYDSAQFQSHHDDVEILHRQDITRRKIREDLWNPFYQEPERGEVLEATAAISNFEQRVEEQRTIAFMTPDERRGWEALHKATAGLASGVPGTTSTRRNARTKEGLAQAFQLIRK